MAIWAKLGVAALVALIACGPVRAQEDVAETAARHSNCCRTRPTSCEMEEAQVASGPRPAGAVLRKLLPCNAS